MTTNTHPGADRTVAGLVAAIRAASTAADFGPELVRTVLRERLAGGGDWLDRRYRHRPSDRDWMLYPLYRAPDRRCSMLVAVFRPGASAPVHNHGTWAVIGVYAGAERETWFRRASDSAAPGRVRLEAMRTFVNDTGAVSVVPDGAIHTVQALDGRDAISIHVYGTDIVTQERSTFDLEHGTEEIFRPEFSAPQPLGAR